MVGGFIPTTLKEALVLSLLEMASLDREDLENCHQLSNIPILGKVIKWVVANEMQICLEEASYLDPFQYRFRPSLGTKQPRSP